MSRKGIRQLYIETYEGDDADEPISLADYFPTPHVGVRRAGSSAEWLA
jgi:hypothetical protein